MILSISKYRYVGLFTDRTANPHLSTFIDKTKAERSDYEFITEDLWKWLKERYDCDHEVKRMYVKQNSKYMFSMETTGSP